MSQLTGWLVNASFDGLTIFPGNKDAAGACKDVAYRGKKGWLVIHGVYGCGKTHLLAATVNACIERKMPAVYFSLAGLLDRLRSSYNDENYDEVMDRLETVDVLAIDEFDIDKISAKPWVKEKVYQLFDARYNEMFKRATLFAMQDEPKKYADNDPAAIFNYIYSRMTDSYNQVIKITSGDYRPVARETLMTEKGADGAGKEAEKTAWITAKHAG